MKVRSLREHNNTYGVATGGPVKKREGVEYEVDEAMAKTLIAAGLVEEIKADEEKPAPAKAPK